MLELESNIGIDLIKNNSQQEFLNTTLWKTINNGIDIGLRYLLPDLIEGEVIELKDNLINYGLKDGIKKSINSVIDTGKQALGILSGNFEDIGQIQKTIKNGGVIDKISDVLDVTINKIEQSGKIDKNTSYIIKKGKSSILSSIEKNIESTLNNQISNAEYLDKYINNWKEYYNNRDLEGMQREYNKIKNNLKELVPLENTLKNARYIENIHTLIKNKGNNFDLTEAEIELSKKLTN